MTRSSLVRAILLVAYGGILVYLCAIALFPEFGAAAHRSLSWFGRPGSVVTIVVVALLPAIVLLGRRLSGRRMFTATPVLVLTAMAGTALVLGMSSYWRCHGLHAPFFAPLAWTLGLFVGSVHDPFVVDPSAIGATVCAGHGFPVALEIARLLAILTTLATALAAAMRLFRGQLDRLAIRRASAVTVIVGVDDGTVSMVDAIARTIGGRDTLVVLTRNDDRPALVRARAAGARVQVVRLDEPESLAGLRLWRRLDRLYLLSEDPVQNIERFEVIDTVVAGLDRQRLRLPLTIRIDNPWEAEVWRRSFLARTDQRWVADAVGCYEITAANLVRHMTRQPPIAGRLPTPTTVLLCGLSPLTHALSSEFAQFQREQQLYQRPDTSGSVSEVVIMARHADSFVIDHQLRQGRMAPDGVALPVRALNAEPTVDEISTFLGGRDPATCAIVLTETLQTESGGTRLAARYPNLRIYEPSEAAKKLAHSAIVGQRYTFVIDMNLDDEAPQDVWERAAELIHEHYSAGSNNDTPTTLHWNDGLDPFVKQSNRRLVLNTLWMVEKFGQQSWNTLESATPEQLPADFFTMPPEEQLARLGFDPAAVELMLRNEHEDWYRFHVAAGWRYGPTRDWDNKRHEKLLSWSEMKDRYPHFVSDSQRNLVSTLINLRSLGYRSIPRPVASAG